MIRKLISYIYPLTKKVQSDYNGILEVTEVNGKKILDTENTNYSYGSLQRILKFSIEKTNLSCANEILILGLGGGSVLETLRNDFNYIGHITAVDIDPVIIEIAEKEFSITPNLNTTIICSDALDYLNQENKKFNLIIIDLFIDNKIPDFCFTDLFWGQLIKLTEKKGYLIFNTLCVPFTNTEAIEKNLLSNGMEFKIFRHVEKTNKVLVANHTNKLAPAILNTH